MKKIKAIWAKIPEGFKAQAGHVVYVFAVTFVATASPALPNVLSEINVGHVPSLSSVRAVVAASFAAGIRAAIPAARAAFVKVCFAVVKYEEKKNPKVIAEIAPVLAAATPSVPPEAR